MYPASCIQARHSSVSWNLMLGRNPLWIAKQHGHSITTMLRVYAAWAEGAIESDIRAIKGAMRSDLSRVQTSMPADRERQTPPCPTPTHSGPRHLAADLAVRPSSEALSAGEARDSTGGERGIRTGFRAFAGSTSY